ncbi:tRNA (adenosine(37)-N6)-dimethylallyltransferase MiaA [Helicobacter monodelphidis]|uniref:tRNA (adenosine(37)-N6)-dimethylallyltransferase MiaA n=1 Tax=Helicobacter sp. 15-1451 TaxID=2004995 RepID=UPI000DCEE8B4|nr:tRNA (adenosine(37)-N6)-dimethylallyltransferase MiaA [Helicobacter sp. 15-1451]RAX57914.1 tRNA (adenosine(37)-N6)-dimethylallyltransferase MiaA [Helicobacter sp. 15-1451]
MNSYLKVVALIGATATGKSNIALEVYRHLQQAMRKILLFSIDSLSVYKTIDIASAKPSKEVLQEVPHYGIDILEPDELCHAGVMMEALKDVLHIAKEESAGLLIVGGSSFYLKSFLEGLSNPPPKLNEAQKLELRDIICRGGGYAFLQDIDAQYAATLKQGDTFRVQKALGIYLATSQTPSEYFLSHQRQSPILRDIPIFEIVKERTEIEQHIKERTAKMLESGLIDEVSALAQKYNNIQPMKSIGIKETLEYLSCRISLEDLNQQIVIHTRQLAKRQCTFNRTQFKGYQVFRGNTQEITQKIIQYFKDAKKMGGFFDGIK